MAAPDAPPPRPGCTSRERDAVGAVIGALKTRAPLVVVTLGDAGCVAACGDEVVFEPAERGIEVLDTTGAGDSFAAVRLRIALALFRALPCSLAEPPRLRQGFIAGLLRGLPLQKCCRWGCLAGAAAVQVLGAEVSQEVWASMRTRDPSVDAK